MSTDKLINKTGMKKTQFAVAAGISYGHLLRILRGEKVSEAYAERVVKILNEKLPPRDKPLTINDLDFNLTD